jgi:hypothetical protein
LHAIYRGWLLSYGEIMSFYGDHDNSIPLTLYARLLMNHGGVNELYQRVPMILTGVLLLLSPLLFMRKLGLHSCVAALLLFATSPMMIFYTVVARPYAPAALLVLLSVYAWDRWVDSGSWRAGLGFALAGALSTFFHLLCFFPLATLVMLAGIESRRGSITKRQLIVPMLLLAIFIGALLGPGIPDLVQSRVEKVGEGSLRLAHAAIGYRRLVGVPFDQVLLFILAALGISKLLWGSGRSRRLGVAMTALLLVQAIAIVATRPAGGAWGRYYFVVWPVFLILVSCGVELAGNVLGRLAPIGRENARLGAVVALAALALSLPARSPMALFRYPESSFRSGKAMLHPARPPKVAMPPVYRRVALEGQVGDVLLIPYTPKNVAWADLSSYQHELAMRFKMAWDRAAAERSRGIQYRNVLDLHDPKALLESGARFLIVQPDALADPATEAIIREHFGEPLLSAAGLDLYQLREKLEPVKL